MKISANPVRHTKFEEISRIKKIGKCNVPISRCLRCGFTFCDILNKNDLYEYCPCCGAKVKEAEENDYGKCQVVYTKNV